MSSPAMHRCARWRCGARRRRLARDASGSGAAAGPPCGRSAVRDGPGRHRAVGHLVDQDQRAHIPVLS
ncbi:MAG: hypothetical protein J0J15_06910, partial [Mesorhizobium sp.]|nr:hypothetical protein [Mesorhizobium sp.]